MYAASFIRQRRIVLEASLLSSPTTLRFIFVHEVFHFAWVRVGNRARNDYARLLTNELQHGARGELGESSAVKKAELRLQPEIPSASKLWRDYLCESFCDSAAYMLTGGSVHEGAKLAKSLDRATARMVRGKIGWRRPLGSLAAVRAIHW